MELAFVVLHYGAIKDTIECVKSIREKVDTKEYRIIIVDNASPDGSYQQLVSLYAEDHDIRLVQNETNLGFAKGNNVGIRIARNEFDPKFVVVLNNDICLIQNNIKQILNQYYEQYRYAVLGPLVLTKDGNYHSNPKGNKIMSKTEAERAIRRAKRILLLHRVCLSNFYLKLEKVKNKFLSKNKDTVLWGKYITPQQNRILHGCFLVFSPHFFEQFDGFDERTFLYMEEEILYKHLMDKGLTTLYCPEMTVFHKEDASTDAALKLTRRKIQFVCENNIKSLNVYIDLLNEENHEK